MFDKALPRTTMPRSSERGFIIKREAKFPNAPTRFVGASARRAIRSWVRGLLDRLFRPDTSSHKGMNGKLMIIGGSHLFHAASLWALEVASRIVDMVFYSSVPENNQIVQKTKEAFRNGIIIPRDQIEAYIQEADCVLIGPGLPRAQGQEEGDDDTKELTERLLSQYPDKRWVIDGGALQMMDPEFIPRNAILTPHPKEFETLFYRVIPNSFRNLSFKSNEMLKPFGSPQGGQVQHDNKVGEVAKKYNCIILLKGPTDIVCSPDECVEIPGGNAGMTKGGTGDVLAGLVGALACKNDLFLAATCASYINKRAGDELYDKVGPYFNASDLAAQIPITMKQLLK